MTGSTDLLDPRQRRAAAILLAAVKLPAEINACTDQYLQAARVWPGCMAGDFFIGDYCGALTTARDLIDELLAAEASRDLARRDRFRPHAAAADALAKHGDLL